MCSSDLGAPGVDTVRQAHVRDVPDAPGGHQVVRRHRDEQLSLRMEVHDGARDAQRGIFVHTRRRHVPFGGATRDVRAEARQEAYTAKNEEEERAAEEASERMLSKQGNTFSGIGQSRHVQQEKSASAQEAERQKELELARKQNAAVEEGGLDALHKARKEAAAHDLKLKLREEKETSQERAAEHKAADKLLAATNLDAHKAATNAVAVSKAARQLAHNVLVHKQMNTLHAQAQARVAKSQMSQHNLRPVDRKSVV